MIDPRRNVPWQFARVAEAHADRLAVAGVSWQPTYRELGDVSNRLAMEIVDRLGTSVRHRDGEFVVAERIAILMPHDAPLLMVMLAVLKAGRTFLVLNPTSRRPDSKASSPMLIRRW